MKEEKPPKGSFKKFWRKARATHIKDARKVMRNAFKKDEDFRHTYVANIAMCIYDNRRKDGRLNIKECNVVADKILKLVFDE